MSEEAQHNTATQEIEVARRLIARAVKENLENNNHTVCELEMLAGILARLASWDFSR